MVTLLIIHSCGAITQAEFDANRITLYEVLESYEQGVIASAEVISYKP